MRPSLVVLVLVPVMLGGLALPAVPAQSTVEDGLGSSGDSQDIENLARLLDIGSRRVTVSAEGDVARVYIARDNASGSDGVFVTFDPERGQLVVAERQQGAPRADALRLSFDRLVAFEDRDGDGTYTPAVDVLGPTWTMRQLDWRVAPVVTSDAGHRAVAVGQIPGGGSLGIAVTTTGSYAQPYGADLRLEDLRLEFAAEAPSNVGNATSLMLVVRDQQRGEVAGLAPTASFPWADVTRGGDGEPQVRVVRADADRADFVRRETSYVTLLEGPTVDRSAATNSTSAKSSLDCALLFRCG